MKKILLISMATMLLFACKRDSTLDNSEAKAGDSITAVQNPDTDKAEDTANSDHCKIATDFLKHYATNYERIYEKEFVTYGAPYSLDFKVVDNYIENAKLPRYFTDRYIRNLISAFVAIDKHLKAYPKNDGTVDGLESDLILHSQEPEELLAQIISGKIKCAKLVPDNVLIDFQNGHSLIFKFHGHEIDDIELK